MEIILFIGRKNMVEGGLRMIMKVISVNIFR